MFHRVNADVATYETVEQRSVARRATESLFSVTHFTGDTVVYNVNGFLDKNRNYYYGLPSDVMEMFGGSSNAIMASAFHSSGHDAAAAAAGGGSPVRTGQALGVRARKSMGTLVKNMRSKLRVVFESLSFGDQYFIQCFRSNNAGIPNAFSPHLVNRSLHVYGVLDCVQVRARLARSAVWEACFALASFLNLPCAVVDRSVSSRLFVSPFVSCAASCRRFRMAWQVQKLHHAFLAHRQGQ